MRGREAPPSGVREIPAATRGRATTLAGPRLPARPPTLWRLPRTAAGMELPPRRRAPPDSPLDSCSLTSLDSSVFCSEGEGEPLALGDCFTVNVGGSRFVLSQQALSCFPHTRLGKLAVVVASCRRPGALTAVPSPLEFCDDANPVDNEYFFDRSSQAFRYVLHYYRTGRLHVMEQLCALSFLQEIQYWGIDELSIDSCCRDRYPRGARWLGGEAGAVERRQQR